MASSRIASLLLPGGKTAHSVFKIPLQPDQTSVCYFDKRSERADLIRETRLIVWDEAPMMNRLAFEAVHRHLQDICDNQNAFGGKLVLFGGDFRQILPVITHGSRESIVAATIHRAIFWNDCSVLHLRINMRLQRIDEPNETVPNVEEFARWILEVGDGQVQGIAISDDGEPNWIKIPEEFLIRNESNGLHNLIASIYPDFDANYADWSYLRERGILAPTNDDVDEINTIMLSMLPGDVKSYLSCDTISNANDCGPFGDMEPPELLHSLKISGLPNHCLDLKIGAPVILLRNLNQSIGLCNGTRLIISKLGDRVIEGKVITGSKVRETVLIPRIDLTPSNLPDLQIKRRHFPLKLVFAMTINKSQGQTLNRVGIYLPRPVFSHGQLYVALSRVSSPSGLKVLLCNKRGVPVDVTKNVVYRDVLNNL